MAPIGYIRLWRKLMTWEWADDPSMVALFVRLLIEVNYKQGLWRGKVAVPPGSTVTSLNKLSVKTGLSIRTLRTKLSALELTNEIAIKSTNHYSMISIVNWGEYQSEQGEPTHGPTCKPTSKVTRQPTTIEEEKKKRRKEEEVAPAFFVHSEIKNVLNQDTQDWLSGKQNGAKGATKNIQTKWVTEYEIDLVCEQINKAYLWTLNNPDKPRKNIGQFTSNFFKDCETKSDLDKLKARTIELMEKGYVD